MSIHGTRRLSSYSDAEKIGLLLSLLRSETSQGRGSTGMSFGPKVAEDLVGYFRTSNHG